ncbi:Protein of uncharacterised function (DUF975([[Clostridium] sordellii]|uniref:Glycerophosphoryl diester phosphodiesterase membrane domain-containing protein n=1 Tax=Paraclostridium sordellii TaxID=1505 RepID=A0ABP1XRS8_PARSO|nr:hypothetical protein [Paeniclostridium sordellii]CEJ73673.1 hypothetical protein ATCC9714_15611 [[Clostridium] sordellii] [Paeniclostridium sordellii]CEN69221.1 Protein of uncharacterised function (DUF975) [[Clostridium] sordellii] [Paeniclostridium sordellii]CEN72489.1 Protein of uncharacterised function (DUF975) [[Clostridium] sordellii] [Paeniclostridium sordellii]CEO23988.1 Protein of uncharacterised function (DUF975) [[Clostridium] sordellii] [Paeniclostridium sordellii]CEP75918.1 Prot
MYKSIKFFSLIEESFLLLRKTTKKIWIIGVIISVLSGSLIFNETGYDNVVIPEETATLDQLGIIESGIILLIFLGIILIILISIASVAYYLDKYIYEIFYDKKIDRAPLGLVVKVNSIVLLKMMLGFMLFIVPGIIVLFKYAPLNYTLCKYPNLSSKEILNKTKDMSKGIKWKIFIFNIILLFIEVVIILATSPNMYVEGYIWIDIFTSVLNFVVSTIKIVFVEIFFINLFIAVDNIKYPNIKCN